MKTILRFLTLFISSTCTICCPVGWKSRIPFTNICYKDLPGLPNYFDGVARCQNLSSGATLPVYKTFDEYDSYRLLYLSWKPVTSDCHMRTWFGISLNDYTKWIDGSDITFSFWNSYLPTNKNVSRCSYHCAAGGTWAQTSCSQNHTVICQLRLDANLTTKANFSGYNVSSTQIQTTTQIINQCPSGWISDGNNICYKYNISSSTTWLKAELYCENLHPGATLPRFCNSTEFIFYNNLMSSLFTSCFQDHWLGFYDAVGDGTYVWINATFFNILPTDFHGFNCSSAYLYGGTYGWQWNISSYYTYMSNNSFPFACQLRRGIDCFNGQTNVAPVANSSWCPKTTSTPTVTTTTIAMATTHGTTVGSDITTTTLTAALKTMGFEEGDTNQSIGLPAKIRDTVPFILQSLNDSVRKQLGYSLDQLILSCSYDGKSCDFETDFKDIYSQTLGNCYTFNPGPNPKMASRTGSLYGLTLILAASQSEYSCTSQSAGFRVVLHENNVTPFPDVQGYNVPLGRSNLFTLYQQNFQRLGYPYATCADAVFAEFFNNYSVEACQRYCFQHLLQKSCQCADPRYPIVNGVRYCGLEQKACLDFNQACESFMSINCGCPPPCNETIYTTTLSSSAMITKDFEATYCGQNNNDTRCKGDFNKNFAVVTIFYERLQVTVLTQTPAYELLNLFADFANVTGTMIGIGAVTLFELLFIVTLAILTYLQKLIQHLTGPTSRHVRYTSMNN